MQGRGLEQAASRRLFVARAVAPHAGAWIGTAPPSWRLSRRESPLMQGRGLELVQPTEQRPGDGRPSCRGVDWNLDGLALAARRTGRPSCRGVDWNTFSATIPAASIVAPHAGAWIGTRFSRAAITPWRRRPSCRGVDWNIQETSGATIDIGRPSCRGVDWNYAGETLLSMAIVAPHAGAWIGTVIPMIARQANDRRPSCRGVDWNT